MTQILDLDQRIEDALDSESMRAVPPGLENRVARRLAVRAMIISEQRRFRRTMGLAACMFCVMGAVGLGLLLFGGVAGWGSAMVPGLVSYLDYLDATQAGASGTPMPVLGFALGLGLAGCCVAGGVGFALGRRPVS